MYSIGEKIYAAESQYCHTLTHIEHVKHTRHTERSIFSTSSHTLCTIIEKEGVFPLEEV